MSLDAIRIPEVRAFTQGSGAARHRPLYFNIVVWGEQFRHYFLEYCLPSLLSPRNIPALARDRGSKFLIATRREDWDALAGTAIFACLRHYVEPVFLELPAAPPGGRDNNYNGLGYNLGLMGVGHRLISARSYRDRAYGVYLAPDCMLSDGSVANLEALACRGTELVLCTALRLGEEPLFDKLAAEGLIPVASRAATGKPLTISGRQMVAAALQALHSETLTYEWEAPYFFARRPSAVWWRVRHGEGLLLHALNWMPLLLDFGAITRHDDSSLETWTLDGDYVYKNIGASRAIHIVQDSDEIFLASWAPMADRPRDVSRRYRRWPFFEVLHSRWVDARKGIEFRDAFYSGYFDPLKQKIFFLPIRWHAGELGPAWQRAKRRSRAVLGRYVALPSGSESTNAIQLRPSTFLFVIVPIRCCARAREYWDHRDIVRECVFGMMHGDIRAWRRVARRLRISLGQIFQ